MNIYAIVGLGYVGLGLATALGNKNQVLGYDINSQRISELKNNFDYNGLVSQSELKQSNVAYTNKLEDIKDANFYIVAVSTPAYYYETPNLEPLIKAVEQLASIIKRGDTIVFESTVFPGTTEEICVPILEENSGLKHGIDFNVGYSPERINPGDKEHNLKNITKIISAQNKETLLKIESAYKSICDTTYPVSSIKAAEAIKVLENTQRDVNIAFMNEFCKIMHAMNINSYEVIEGAKTKWSFIPIKPGLVGGHCISIDPHYLAFKAKRHGVSPDLILTARKVNDNITQFILQSMLKLLIKNKMDTNNLNIGILGITYKENTNDIRNSLALKIVKELRDYGFNCHIHDPIVNAKAAATNSINIESFTSLRELSVIILAVGHDFYREIGLKKIISCCKNSPVLIDIPNLFIKDYQQFPELIYWSL